MSCTRIVAATLLLAHGCLSQNTHVRDLIEQKYTLTMNSLRNARTRADIERIVNEIDVPEWVASLPAGETVTRLEAIATLEPLLSIPPEKRPIPRQQFLYMTETGWNALVVYWVYRESEGRLIGSLARDTWVQTAQGWKRIRHEKLFPDRPLMANGKSLLLDTPGR